jgi:glycosyltransferase involved in cell wall biosynthesis
VGVVIPAYKVSKHIIGVLEDLSDSVDRICVVDDACPEQSGKLVESYFDIKKVSVLYHEKNKGVGAAMKTGFTHLLTQDVDVIVKVDGDGQMKAHQIDSLLSPLVKNLADYAKGNRFYSFESIKEIPRIRLIGNIVLSFMSKAASGYWNIFDPNNGYIAVTTPVLREMNLDQVSNRYFFESDMLFRLYLVRARVIDVPMMAVYGSERSSLSIWKSAFEFPAKYVRNFLKRLYLMYIVRDFSLPGLQLVSGIVLSTSGTFLGMYNFLRSQALEIETAPGTLILFALLMLVGLQLLLSFLSFDVQNVPDRAITRDIELVQDGPTSKSN